MRKLFVILMLLTLLCCKENNNLLTILKDLELNQIVKSVETYNMFATENMGEIITSDTISYKKIELNEFGHIIREKSYNYFGNYYQNHSFQFTFNDKMLIEKSEIDENNNLVYKYYHKYDEKNNLIQVKTFNPDGALAFLETYSYDKKNNLIKYEKSDISNLDANWGKSIKTLKYDTNNKLISATTQYKDSSLQNREVYKYLKTNEYEITKYDSKNRINEFSKYHNNLLVESIFYETDGEIISHFIDEYEYDNKGNWIKIISTRNDRIFSIHTRTIRY